MKPQPSYQPTLYSFLSKLLIGVSMLVALVAHAATGDYEVEWESKFNLPPQDVSGWSILQPSSDSRIMYVSNAGNDSTAQIYTKSDSAIGSDVFNPKGDVKAFSSFAAAMSNARQGYPDYVLLRRGDSWSTSGITPKAGRSVKERSVLGYYGAAIERPTIKTGNNAGINITDNSNNSAVVGIRFVAQKRNPNSSEFVGFANVQSVRGLDIYVSSSDHVNGILIEDCWLDWFEENAIQTNGNGTDLVLRRNLITNHYSTESHSQGLYLNAAELFLDENIFDHNGWYQIGDDAGSNKSVGGATKFNHNTYFAFARNIVMRGNFFLRASSMGNKFTANPSGGTNTIEAWNILMDNNFYAHGELGIGIGGNKDNGDGPRFKNIHIVNNVLTEIGHGRPTDRNIGWGVAMDDWDGGVFTKNLFTHIGNTDTVVNVYAWSAGGHSTGVSYTDNIAYDINGKEDREFVKFENGATHKNVVISGNHIQATEGSLTTLMEYALDPPGVIPENNFLWSPKDQSRWVTPNSGFITLDQYRADSGDYTSVATKLDYVDPERTIATYMKSMGKTGALQSLIDELTKQSKMNWRPQYTAKALNTYMRNGYCVVGNECVDVVVNEPVSPPKPPTNITVTTP